MATTRRTQATHRNGTKGRAAPRTRARGGSAPRNPTRLTTAEQNGLRDSQFAFPKQRKEPLVDARHVRNAVARFDQVEGVSNADRDRAWRRIRAAARKYGVTIHERGWRQLMHR